MVSTLWSASGAIVWVMGCMLGAGSAFAGSALIPSAAFVQLGTSSHTHEGSAGLVWDWNKDWSLGPGRVSGYWEGSVSEWSYPSMDERRTAWLGQFGLTPVFRYRPASGASAWFAEAGIGATVTTTLYETERKRFSTIFNFGDHIGLGFNFGSRREHEIVLRVEHFSNGGIKHPNPGENFVQIRYGYRFAYQ